MEVDKTSERGNVMPRAYEQTAGFSRAYMTLLSARWDLLVGWVGCKSGSDCAAVPDPDWAISPDVGSLAT